MTDKTKINKCFIRIIKEDGKTTHFYVFKVNNALGCYEITGILFKPYINRTGGFGTSSYRMEPILAEHVVNDLSIEISDTVLELYFKQASEPKIEWEQISEITTDGPRNEPQPQPQEGERKIEV